MTKEERFNYTQDLIWGSSYEHPLTARDLAFRWKTNERAVRQIVNELRCLGEPIGSDNKGYWYAVDPIEMAGTVRRIRAHALKELTAMAKMRRVCKEAGLDV